MTKYYPKGHPMAEKLREKRAAEAKRAAHPPRPDAPSFYTTPELARFLARALPERDKLIAAETIRKLDLGGRDQRTADAVVAKLDSIGAFRRRLG